MRVAISGASGFLARALIPRLELEGHDVVRLVRPSSQGSGIAWDPDADSIDAAALEGIEALVHLGGVGIGDRRWTKERKTLVWRSRVGSTGLLARAIAGMQRPPSVFVVASAVGYYGDRGAQVLDEDSGPGGGFLAELCVAWEDAAEPARAAGVRVVPIRTGIVLGHGGSLFKRLVPAFRFGVGGKLGDGTQYQSWISHADHARAVAFLLAGDLEGPVNLTAPEPVTNAELTRAMGRAMHRPSFMAVPRAAIRLALGRELADELLASQRALPARLTGAGFRFEHDVIDAALASMFP